MLEKYLPRIDFDSYEDFKANYKVNVPEDFNFGFDIVDGWAKEKPENRALVWCDDDGEEKTFTFAEMSKLSNQAANYFKSLGLHKGSVVMMILRRRYEYWICATALIKMGVIIIPGTLQLTTHDLVYRAKAANIEMFIGIDDDFVVEQIENTVKEVPEVKNIMLVNGHRVGWLNLHDGMEGQSDVFERPTGDERTHNTDIMQIYFTSGTTGMPKMVCHNYMHPLGHIVTAKYWQCVRENMLHMSVSDSGWAKFGWGKIYGQWICGATIFCYDMKKFHPENLLAVLQKYQVTTFCAPPTMYRFMLQEDVAAYDLSSVKRWCTAGEPLNPEVVRKWKEFTGYTIAEGFGQTESTVLLANFPWYEPKPGSMGKPSPIYNIRLLNSNGVEAEDGEEGEITISVPKDNYPIGLFVGYYRDEKMTDEAIGMCAIAESDPGHFDECGICIGTRYHGRGYGKEIVALLLDLAFRKLGAADFRYGYDPDNTPSRRLAASFGFRFDKSYPLTRPWDGQVKDIESSYNIPVPRIPGKIQRVTTAGRPYGGDFNGIQGYEIHRGAGALRRAGREHQRLCV